MLFAGRGTSYPSWLLYPEKMHQVVPIQGEAGACEYRVWETFGGIGAHVVARTTRNVVDEAVRRGADNLKDFIEKRNA
jgi:hypothetical protein